MAELAIQYPPENANPEFNNGGEYIRQMPTGYANLATSWKKYDVASQILRGTMTFSKDKLKELDPSYTGFTHIFCLRMPLFMKHIMQGNYIAGFEEEIQERVTYHYWNLKTLLEMGSTSYSGTPNLTMDTAEVNVGWSEKNYAVPTKSQYDGKQFTIKCLETRGEPLRAAMEYYINACFDATGKFAHCGGAATPEGRPMEPSLANTTFSFMVVQTDQTLLNIQNIDLWNNCFFTEVDRSHLDWNQGEIDIVQPKDVQFQGIYLPATDNKTVFEKAKRMLSTRILYYKRIQDLTDYDLRLDAGEEEDLESA